MGSHLPAEFARVLKTNTEAYLKKVENCVPTISALYGQLKKRGRIKTTGDAEGGLGPNVNWKVKKARRTLTPITDAAAFTVSRSSNYDEAKMGWWGYRMEDAITEKERLMNGSAQTRILNVVGTMMDDMKEDFLGAFNAELFKNNETTTYAGRLAGLESIFQISTATLPTGGAGGAILAVGAHSTLTYAGIQLAAVSNANYYWRPKIIIDANSSQFGAGGFLSSTAMKIMDYACVQHSYNNDNKRPHMGITNATWLQHLRNAVLGKTSVASNRPMSFKEESDDLGFWNLNYDGVPVYGEPNDWPTMKQGGTGGMYLLNLDKMHYETLGSNFFNFHMQDDLQGGLATLFALTHYGRLRTASPLFQTKIVDQT